MKRIVTLTAALWLAALPLQAQETESDDGFSMMERGAQLFFEGIMREMEPALDDLKGLADEIEPKMREFAEQMGPALADLLAQIEDLNAYHPPEMLPNGDIIMRKKTPEEMLQEPESGEIEI